jgi:thiamine pyrophosphate-dependent acetolactate synthase large subunit-like protein
MMESLDVQKIISRYRGDAIVVPTMTTNREWPQVSTKPDLDLMLSGAMGKASSVGLGLALARPDRKVVVLDGDGSLLMNLGSLVTIAGMAPPNMILFVFENDIYRTTGGQPIPYAGRFSFPDMARAAGFADAHEFVNLESLENGMEGIMNQPGPTLVNVKVAPHKERPPFPMTRTPSIIARFREALVAAPPSI